MKTFIFSLMILAMQQLTAQEFQGIARYRMNQKTNIKLDSTRHTDAMAKQINEQLSAHFDREYTLKFNRNESLFKEEEKLEVEKPRVGVSGVIVMGGGGQFLLYKNLSEKSFVKQEDLMGKRFLIKDSLSLPNWKMEGDQKKIGNHTVYKATWTREEERNSWSTETGQTKTMVEVVTTAWYTPEIPVNHGPQNYWGLPGLILEIQEGDKRLLCIGITLNPQTRFEIEVPDKGKEVDQASFVKLKEEKTREMIETYRGGGQDGKAIRINNN